MPRSQQDKPFRIPKQAVWQAYEKVKRNQGAPGVDGQSLAEFEAGLQGNLYKIWNRMSSGTYFPPAVRAVEIPKAHGGGVRVLGVPTVADRVAMTVAATYLETRAEPRFHRDSYGYRPGRSPQDAVAVCRERCRGYDWAIDCDVQKFFDSVPWELIVKAVEAVTTERWLLLYVRRWLAVPLQQADGTLAERHAGTPQGSPLSPVLANLFMHYAFDTWISREHPGVVFERFADDIVVHCKTRRQAEQVAAATAGRLGELGLRLHPDKTKIVYCKDGRRRGSHEHTSFDFLGFTFRAREARAKDGRKFLSFLPAMSTTAMKAKSAGLRAMRIHRRTTWTLSELARWLNPVVGGWMNYYGRFYRSAMAPLLRRVNTYMKRWAWRKYKRLRSHKMFQRWWAGLRKRAPMLLAQWKWVTAY
jgi:RNA-directed DNA polymerase